MIPEDLLQPVDWLCAKSSRAQLQGETCTRKAELSPDVRAALTSLIKICNEELSAVMADDLGKINDVAVKLNAASSTRAALSRLYFEHLEMDVC
jgi:hypothetical protein